jgi:hypothetical protein
MAALLARRRLGVSAAESVDELAQMEQITEPAEIVAALSGIVRRRPPGLRGPPIAPVGRNQRTATVRQHHEEKEDAAPPDAAYHGQRPAFEDMSFAGDDHRIRNLTVMGSLSPLPSTASATIG